MPVRLPDNEPDDLDVWIKRLTPAGKKPRR
jgi:hypothetical protein